MESIADKLVDVATRIADSELRIAEQQERIAHRNCDEAALAAIMLYSVVSTLRELRVHKARLEESISARKCPPIVREHICAGVAEGLTEIRRRGLSVGTASPK